MRKYTQEEFDSFELDYWGCKICPTGDYTDIKSFDEQCIFGEWCSFGERCSFGEHCRFENEKVKNGTFFTCDGMGAFKTKIYFFIDGKKQIYVRYDCFFGTEEEFIKQIQEKYHDTRFEKECMMALELARVVLEGK